MRPNPLSFLQEILRTRSVQNTLSNLKTDSLRCCSFRLKPTLCAQLPAVLLNFSETPAPDFKSCAVCAACAGPASRRQFQYPALRDRTCFLIKESAFLPPVCACALATKCDGCDCRVNGVVKCWRQLQFPPPPLSAPRALLF